MRGALPTPTRLERAGMNLRSAARGARLARSALVLPFAGTRPQSVCHADASNYRPWKTRI